MLSEYCGKSAVSRDHIKGLVDSTYQNTLRTLKKRLKCTICISDLSVFIFLLFYHYLFQIMSVILLYDSETITIEN